MGRWECKKSEKTWERSKTRKENLKSLLDNLLVLHGWLSANPKIIFFSKEKIDDKYLHV